MNSFLIMIVFFISYQQDHLPSDLVVLHLAQRSYIQIADCNVRSNEPVETERRSLVEGGRVGYRVRGGAQFWVTRDGVEWFQLATHCHLLWWLILLSFWRPSQILIQSALSSQSV